MVNAQFWLELKYPKEQRITIKKLSIDSSVSGGSLDLSDFANLEELASSNNKLTSLNLNNCSKLAVIFCPHNNLTKLDLSGCSGLTYLSCNYNNLTDLILPENLSDLKFLALNCNNFNQDLSFLKEAVNLDMLGLSDNKFYGSLKCLSKMRKLKILDIRNTDIESGLEYLPDSLEKFECLANGRKDAKCQAIYNLFANEQGEVETDICGISYFPQKLQKYKKNQEQFQQIVQIQQTNLLTKK